MQQLKYNKNELNISKIKLFYTAIIIRLAKFCIFPATRRFFYRLLGVNIGKEVTISPNVDIVDYSLGKFLSLGDRVAVAPNVTFLISSSPNMSKLKAIYPKIYGPITIEEDVWIGSGVIILPGITVGKCSIIGAGSIVTKDIPPYCVAAGNPARILKKINTNDLGDI